MQRMLHLIKRISLGFIAAVFTLALFLPLCLPFLSFAEAGQDLVRVGFFESEKYGYLDANGNLRGYDVELSEAIGVYGNFQVEMVAFTAVSEMEEALRDGSVDLLFDFLKTKEREKEFIFTSRPVLEETISVYTHYDKDAWKPNESGTIEKLSVGYVEQSGFLAPFLDYCEKHEISPKLMGYPNEQAAQEALSQGAVDALLTGSAIQAGCRSLLTLRLEPSYIMLRREDTDLRDRIDAAFLQLLTDNQGYQSELYNRYVNAHNTELSYFTEEEQAYLKAHPTMKVAFVRTAAPFVIVENDGTVRGILPEYYQALGKKLGVSFTFSLYDSLQETIDAVLSGRDDVVGHYYGDIVIAEASGLLPTEEYSITNCARLVRKGFTGFVRTAAVTDRTLPTLKEQLVDGTILRSYGSIEECYQAVISGETDAFIGSMTAATWLINQHSTRGVQLSIIPGITLSLRGAVAQDNRILYFILDNAIRASVHDLMTVSVENSTVQIDSIKAYLENIPFSYTLGIVAIMGTLLIALLVLVIALIRVHRERISILRQKTEVDDLTGAASRSYGESLMKHELEIFRKAGSSPLFAIMDIDNFKQKNDRYGHTYGDYVLTKTVEVIRGSIRSTDNMIRWGGDEFILICRDVPRETAGTVLEKIVRNVRNADCSDEMVDFSVTISVGADFYRPEDQDIDSLVRRIDKLLYEAKKEKNCWRLQGEGKEGPGGLTSLS